MYYSYDYSLILPPNIYNVYVEYLGAYYLQREPLKIYKYETNELCHVIDTNQDILVYITSFMDNDMHLYAGNTEFSSSLFSTNITKYILNTEGLALGEYDIIFLENDSLNISVKVNDEKIIIINNYTVIGREPAEIIKPYVTVEFLYDNDNLDYVTFYLFQDDIIVEHKDNALYDTNMITVHFKEDFKKLKEGEATLYETYRTCTGTATEDSKFSVIIRNAKIYEVGFDITIQMPIIVGDIMITIKSEYLYNLQDITEITFNVIDYLGNTNNKVISRENINYNEVNDELTLSVIYVTGELIELM